MSNEKEPPKSKLLSGAAPLVTTDEFYRGKLLSGTAPTEPVTLSNDLYRGRADPSEYKEGIKGPFWSGAPNDLNEAFTKAGLLSSSADPRPNSEKWEFVSPAGNKVMAPPGDYAAIVEAEVKRALAKEKRMLAREKSPFAMEGHTDSAEKVPLMKEEFLRFLRAPLVLEKVHHSIAHRITPKDLPVEAHILLVNHDWSALFKNAEVTGASGTKGGVNLPYPITVFEFMFKGGVHAVCVAIQKPSASDPHDVRSVTFFKMKSGWFRANFELVYDELGNLVTWASGPERELVKVYSLITHNIYAISVMLEAQVAEATPVREAYKRNRERPIRKEIPGMSHHIVSLARRARSVRSEFPSEERRSPRLHFRRGHWRHFSSHRTWIKWQLVGDPDLGFIEKEYSL